jgi:hypothetical protein
MHEDGYRALWNDIDFDIDNITETSSCMFGFQIQDVDLEPSTKRNLVIN